MTVRQQSESVRLDDGARTVAAPCPVPAQQPICGREDKMKTALLTLVLSLA